VTILHCRRYVREYIPEKRDLARSRQEDFTAKLATDLVRRRLHDTRIPKTNVR